MGLKIWLPLNGNLENIGCSSVTVTNNGATVNANGKIGSCYAFNGSSKITATGVSIPAGPISASAWVYFDTNITDLQYIISLNAGGGFADHEVGLAIQSSQYYFVVGGNSSCTIGTPVLNTWTHMTVTFDGSTIRGYINGTLVKSVSSTATLTKTTFTVGARNNGSTNYAYFLKGLTNDVRIYDHCLSAAEVHEISQGLVLHYKLDDTYMETPTFLTSTINTTAYNSQNGKYGYNADSNLARTEGFFQGKNCIKISTITAGQNAQPYSYFSNLYTSNGTNSPAYKALSFDYFTTCPTTTWLNIYKLGSGTGTAMWKTVSATAGTRTGTYTNSSNSILVQPNEWNRVEIIFNGTTDADAQWGYCINGPKHTSSADYYFLFSNIQLEQNDHVTGQGEGLHKAIITDSSGYGHNGTKYGSITCASNSARYSNCLYLPNGNTDYIYTDVGVGNPSDAITMNIWFKSNNKTPGTDYHHCFNGLTSWVYIEMAVHKNGYMRSGLYIGGSRYVANTSNTNILDGNWHMLTMTYNGAQVKRYVDGVLRTEATQNATGAIDRPNDRFVFGRGASTGYYCKEAYLSDARLYATALSDADILSLYNTAAKVNNLGGLHTFEAIEELPNIIFKIDSARGAKIFQDGLSRYTQANCQVTLTDDGYRIYRPPNYNPTDNGNTMWGGLKLVNQTSDTVSPYNTARDNSWGLQKTHTYLLAFYAKGQSNNSTSVGFTNNMGWGVGGVSPNPTILVNSGIPTNFQGEKDCFCVFTINDDIIKTSNDARAGYDGSSQYLSYRHFTFGWGYTNTGALGTDVYLTNFRLYDITNIVGKIKKNGQADFADFVEHNGIAKIEKKAEFLTNNLIEF